MTTMTAEEQAMARRAAARKAREARAAERWQALTESIAARHAKATADARKALQAAEAAFTSAARDGRNAMAEHQAWKAAVTAYNAQAARAHEEFTAADKAREAEWATLTNQAKNKPALRGGVLNGTHTQEHADAVEADWLRRASEYAGEPVTVMAQESIWPDPQPPAAVRPSRPQPVTVPAYLDALAAAVRDG